LPRIARPPPWWRLMVSLVVSATLSSVGRWWSPLFGEWETVAAAANAGGSFALVTAMFALIYKIMPRVSVDGRDVWIDAAFTAVLFTLGRLLIGVYVARRGVVWGFGAAGSLVVVLVWVCCSAQIFLFGAEFAWIYANGFGSRREQSGAAAADQMRPGTQAMPRSS
jgi:membrane protein